MKKLQLISSIIALSFAAFTASVSANTISMTAPATAAPLDTFDVTIFGDFPNGLIAGGGLFLYDPLAVSINSVTLTSPSPADPAFSCPGGGNCGGTGPGQEAIHWGSFSQVVGAGLGTVQMALVNLTALLPGVTNFTMVDDPNAGGWFDLGFGDATPAFSGTSINIKAAVIPVPAAVWLFGSGLLGLVGVARRRKAA